MVSQGGHLSGDLIRVVSHLGGLSPGWSLRVVMHQVISHQGGLISVVSHRGSLSPGWSLRVVIHQVMSHQGGLSPGWSLIRVVFD